MNLEICKKCLGVENIKLFVTTAYYQNGKPFYTVEIWGKGKTIQNCPLTCDKNFSRRKHFQSKKKVDALIWDGKTKGIVKLNENCLCLLEQKMSEWYES